jgi:hypothetical protein
LTLPAARAEVDILYLLIPGAERISGCKPRDQLEVGERYELNTANAPDGIPVEAIADEVFAQGWGDNKLGFLFLYRAAPEYLEHLESL